MKLGILNTAVVVLAKHHNPTILHPSFLTSQDIVPSDWELAEPPVCTPVFAVVKYKNGIVFNVGERNFQVTDNQGGDDYEKSQVADLALKYTTVLPHVHYSAIGINFGGFIECVGPEKIVLDRFLKEGPADLDGNRPTALGLRLVYMLEDTRLKLSVEAGTIKLANGEKERNGVLVNGNFHTELKQEDRIDQLEKVTEFFPARCGEFSAVVRSLFQLEE